MVLPLIIKLLLGDNAKITTYLHFAFHSYFGFISSKTMSSCAFIKNSLSVMLQ